MAGIGGLDVSYGARHQIIRTNVAVVETTTTTPTEAHCKSMFDLLSMGLSHSILAPDFLLTMDGAATPSLATAAFQVDTTGNGSVDSTTISKGPLLRDPRQVPLAPNSSPAPVGELTAQDALVADVAANGSVIATLPSTNLALEAVLNMGACHLSATAGTGTTGATAFNVGEDTALGSEHGTTDAALIGEINLGNSGPTGVMSAAMAAAVNQMDAVSDYNVAGQPEAVVSTLDLSGAVSEIQNATTAVNITGNLATLLSNHDTNGRTISSSTTATAPNFGNFLALAGQAIGILSVTSIAKVL